MTEPTEKRETDWESREFAPAERSRLRKQMRDWDRCSWAWKVAVQVVGYSAVVIGTMYAMRDVIVRVAKAIMGGPQ